MPPPAADWVLADAERPADAPALDLPEDADPRSVPRAIAVAALLSLPFWGLVAFALYRLL